MTLKVAKNDDCFVDPQGYDCQINYMKGLSLKVTKVSWNRNYASNIRFLFLNMSI